MKTLIIQISKEGNSMKSKYLLYGIGLAIFILMGLNPALGIIDVEYTSEYDANGDLTSYLGEEVYVSVNIEPGNNQITDMEIKIVSGSEALVDYSSKSFEESSVPAGSVDLQIVEGDNIRTYRCEKLEPNQALTLNFRAYPKTIKENEIEVSKITIYYTQLGERYENKLTVTADTSDSSWHTYTDMKVFIDEAEENLNTGQMFKYFGIVMGALVVLMLVIFIIWIRRQN